MRHVDESLVQEGWLPMEQIAVSEGLIYYLTHEDQMQTLKDICSVLPQRPHPNPVGAGMEHKQYPSTCENMKNNTCRTTRSMEVSAQVGGH